MTTRRGQLVWLIAWWLPLAAVAVGQEADQSPPSPFANPEQSPAGLGDLLPAVDRAAASDASDPQPAPAQRATKAAVPAPAAQAAVLKQIDEIFGRPTQPALMLKLAATLLKTGQEDKVPANQYAQFRRAGELALAAGDLQVAAQAADLLGARFQIDVLALKAGLAEQSAGRIPDEQLLDFAAAQFDQALAADHFAAARRLGTVGYKAALATRDKDRIAAMRQRAALLAARQAAYGALAAALATLQNDPADLPANSQVGEYLAYLKGDWQRGLKLLARAGHPIARAEAAVGDDAEAQRKLADSWWELAETKTGPAGASIQAHAAGWYRQALPKLSGLTRLKVEKLLAELDERGSTGSGEDVAAGLPAHRSRTDKKPDQGPQWVPPGKDGYLTHCLKLGPYPRSAIDDRAVLLYLSKGKFDKPLLGLKPAPDVASGASGAAEQGQQIFIGPKKDQADHVMYYLFHVKCDKDQVVNLRARTFTRWDHSTVAVALDYRPITSDGNVPLKHGRHTLLVRQHHKKSDTEGRSWISLELRGEGLEQEATAKTEAPVEGAEPTE